MIADPVITEEDIQAACRALEIPARKREFVAGGIIAKENTGWPRARILCEVRRPTPGERNLHLWDGRRGRAGAKVWIPVPICWCRDLGNGFVEMPEWLAYDRGFMG